MEAEENSRFVSQAGNIYNQQVPRQLSIPHRPSPGGMLALGSQPLFPEKQTLGLHFVICHLMSLFHYLQNGDVNKTYLVGLF